MSKAHSLDLLFVSPRKDELPGEPRAQVCLKTWTRGRVRGAETSPLITPQCVTIRELEHEIARLRRELDVIGRNARKRFAAADKRMEDWRKRPRA